MSSKPTGLSVASGINLPRDTEAFLDMTSKFRELLMMYECAVREVKTKLEVLNDDLSVRHKRNPIEQIDSRIKKPESIFEKLNRKGLPITLSSISENLNDVAGVRVICSFTDDIYNVARMLAKQDDITLIRVKDYIKNPKPNGYRSYHMIVEIPVFFSDEKRNLRVEVQLRTKAQDFWASLEHQLKYKSDSPERQDIADELFECAQTLAAADEKMLDLRRRINNEE